MELCQDLENSVAMLTKNLKHDVDGVNDKMEMLGRKVDKNMIHLEGIRKSLDEFLKKLNDATAKLAQLS